MPRTKRFNGLNNDAKSPCAFPLLPPDETDAEDMARAPDDAKLVFGTAIIVVIEGDEAAAEGLEDVIFIPDSDDALHGRNTLMHDRERKSHTRNVPSFDPLASSALLPLPNEDVKVDGSNSAREVTALACPFNSDM